MEKFYKYRTNKPQVQSVPRKNVSTKDEIMKFRLTSEMKNKILEVVEEKGKSASELTRLLWEDYLTKKRNIEWQKEVEEW